MAQEEKKAPSIMDGMNEDLIKSFIEAALPKIMPFVAPALEKFNEFIGDDDKTIIIRKMKGSSANVIVFDNTKLDEVGYNIKYNSKERVFTCNDEIMVHSAIGIEGFIEKLLNGELSKD